MQGDPGVLTYLTDAQEPRPGEGALCVGDPVVVRQGSRRGRLEAWSATGRKLGSLPPDESAILSSLLADGTGRLRGARALHPNTALNQDDDDVLTA